MGTAAGTAVAHNRIAPGGPEVSVNFHSIMKFFGYAVLGLISFPLILLMAFRTSSWIDDARFAREFFTGRVEVVRVVASKRWLDFGEGIGCTYAAVEFSEETADRLRAEGPEALRGEGRRRFPWNNWPGSWNRTPAAGVSDHVFAPFSCLRQFPKRYAELIAESLEQPGSWYAEGTEVGAFLSADHRLAVSLRNGD